LLELEYESMTTNPSPRLAGRVREGSAADLAMRLRGHDWDFDSGLVHIGNQPSFAVPLKLRRGVLNLFHVEAFKGGSGIPCDPPSFSILHGLSVSKPPLSQSVGVMLADNSVCWYLRKGAVLPARNSLVHATTIPLPKGQSVDAVKVPLIQGESERGDRNTVIGILCIHAEHIARDLPAGAAIEVTLSVDEFSRTTARAYVPLLDQWFDHIIQLGKEGKNADKVALEFGEQRDRLKQLEQQAEALQLAEPDSLDGRIREVEQLIAEGDRDSVDLADQLVRLMTRHLDRLEGQARTEKLRADFSERSSRAENVLASPAERQELEELGQEFHTALTRGDTVVAEQKFEVVGDLMWNAYLRMPEFWKYQLQQLYQKFQELGMLSVAQQKFADGAAAMEQDSLQDLVRICCELLAMLPGDQRKQFEGVVSHITGGK
jgi:molecular chaperone DnaK